MFCKIGAQCSDSVVFFFYCGASLGARLVVMCTFIVADRRLDAIDIVDSRSQAPISTRRKATQPQSTIALVQSVSARALAVHRASVPSEALPTEPPAKV